MTNEEFVLQVAIMYRNARQTARPNEVIKRGRSHTISSQVEDLFASFVFDALEDEIVNKGLIFVDQPITVQLAEKSRTIYPDIAIAFGNRITQLWDLKMDLGWNRKGFLDFCKEKANLLKNMRGAMVKLTVGETKLKLEGYGFSEGLTFNIAVVSGRNISRTILDSHLAGTAGLDGLDVFLLTDTVHPNDYAYESAEHLLSKINIDKGEFNRLREKLNEAAA